MPMAAVQPSPLPEKRLRFELSPCERMPPPNGRRNVDPQYFRAQGIVGKDVQASYPAQSLARSPAKVKRRGPVGPPHLSALLSTHLSFPNDDSAGQQAIRRAHFPTLDGPLQT